jgi:hypothetical protein
MGRINMQFLFIVVSFMIATFSVSNLWDLINKSNDVWKLV